MDPKLAAITRSRREFLTTFAGGVGGLALADLLARDGVLAAEGGAELDLESANPLMPRAPHFAPKAKSCIFIFLEGAPSQIDLYDPKPKLNELHGQKLPESMTEKVRFAFIQKETAVLLGSNRKFAPRGQCGMELSDFLPHLSTCVDDMCLIRSMHTEAFNHHPGQLMMNTGTTMFGRPSMGSWLNYGLGSESSDLPGYVVLTAGRGTSGGASLWSSGFLPSTYQGVLFRNQGDPVLNLSNPNGLSRAMQRDSLDALARLNSRRYDHLNDPEIVSRIAAYELAFRMQSAAPELINLGDESQRTLDDYGVERETPSGSYRGGGPNVMGAFATNCLLARRLVERGVRFVNLYHASWDQHSDLDRELAFNTQVADQPVAALIKDLKQRGLLDSTLVVFAGEFGRTPLGENRGGNPKATGRDHHPFAYSLWLAGGGIKGGQVIGASDEIGAMPKDRPLTPGHIAATMYHGLGIPLETELPGAQGRPIRVVDHGIEPVRELFV